MENLEKIADKSSSFISFARVLDAIFVPTSTYRGVKGMSKLMGRDLTLTHYIGIAEAEILRLGLYCAALYHLGVISHLYS
jgi:hypothetical protein